jgi:hypothetical protein
VTAVPAPLPVPAASLFSAPAGVAGLTTHAYRAERPEVSEPEAPGGEREAQVPALDGPS